MESSITPVAQEGLGYVLFLPTDFAWGPVNIWLNVSGPSCQLEVSCVDLCLRSRAPRDGLYPQPLDVTVFLQGLTNPGKPISDGVGAAGYVGEDNPASQILPFYLYLLNYGS